MSDSKNTLPEYFREKDNMTFTVTFVALFSVVFLILTLPFSHSSWFQLGNSKLFVFTLAFGFFALMIIIFSKFIMYKTRYKINMTLLGYICWIVIEVLVICLAYTALTINVVPSIEYGFGTILLRSLVYGILSLIIPYVLAGMYFAITDKNKTIRLMKLDNVVSDENISPVNLEKITLFDNSGVLRMSVSASNLYYIESDDNYIVVWYTDSKGALKKYMLRCRLKTIEESFKGSSLVRCHRKYIVNMDKVKVLRKEKDGYELDLDNDNIPPISITKTYTKNVLNRFNSSERNFVSED